LIRRWRVRILSFVGARILNVFVIGTTLAKSTRMNTMLRNLSMLIVASTLACSAHNEWGVGTGDTGETESALTSNQKTAYNYFISKGFKPYQAAAIVGNLMQESSVKPTSYQYGGGPGRGIAQWSAGGRWDKTPNDNMLWFASSRGLDPWTLGAQLDFIYYELTTFGAYGLGALENASGVVAATIAFQDKFEICGSCSQSQRIAYAQQILYDYGSGGGGSSNYSAGCWSATYQSQVQNNVCIQSKFDGLWYECDDGDWVDRWSDPTPCNGVYPYY